MSSDRTPATAVGARIGAAFSLLMKVRMLLCSVSLLLVPRERWTANEILIVLGIGLLSGLALVAWQQIVPWLLSYPVLLGFDVFVSYAVLEGGGVLGPFFLFTVVTSAVAGLLYRRSGMLAVCTMQIVLYYAAAVSGPETLTGFGSAVTMPAFYLVAGFVGLGLRRLFDEHAALDQARHQAEVLAAAAEERTRLAREMHDSLAKTLRGISMSAIALPAWVSRSPSRAVEEAQRIAAAAEIASREARQLIADLRADIVQRPLGSMLGELAADWSAAAGPAASVVADPDVDLPLRTRYELVAILKEALENVARHAEAATVEIGLERRADEVVLTVRDDGRGFAAAADDLSGLVREGHYGLVGMRERAAHVGAEMTVESQVGAGTTVTVTVPSALDEPERDRHLEVA